MTTISLRDDGAVVAYRQLLSFYVDDAKGTAALSNELRDDGVLFLFCAAEADKNVMYVRPTDRLLSLLATVKDRNKPKPQQRPRGE